MKTIFAKTVSGIFHPMLVPFVSTLLLLYSNTYLALTLPSMYKFVLCLLMFVTTGLLPGLSVVFMKKKGWVSSLESPERNERVLPFFSTIVCYSGAGYLFYSLPVSQMFTLVIVCAGVAVLAGFVITFFWKISIHMMGVGGFLGVITGYGLIYEARVIGLLMIVSIIAGMLGTSRLILKAHSPMEVYSGFLVGFFVEMLFIYSAFTPHLKG